MKKDSPMWEVNLVVRFSLRKRLSLRTLRQKLLTAESERTSRGRKETLMLREGGRRSWTLLASKTGKPRAEHFGFDCVFVARERIHQIVRKRINQEKARQKKTACQHHVPRVMAQAVCDSKPDPRPGVGKKGNMEGFDSAMTSVCNFVWATVPTPTAGRWRIFNPT